MKIERRFLTKVLAAWLMLAACAPAFSQVLPSADRRLTDSVGQMDRQAAASARLHEGLTSAARSVSAPRTSDAAFWDGNTRKGDVAGPVAAYAGAPRFASGSVAAVGAASDAVPAPASAQAQTQGQAAASACRDALSAYPTTSKLCEKHPVLAPIAAGVLEAFRQQFGTVEGLLSNLAWILISLVMSVVSGFGMVAKIAMGLIGTGLTIWMLWPVIKQGYEAVRDFSRAKKNSEEYFSSLYKMGLVGGTVLILALLAALGYGIGKSKVGQAAFASMDHLLSTKVAGIGLPTAAAADPWTPGSVASLMLNIAEPEARVGRHVAGAVTAGAERAAEFGGNRNLSQQQRDQR